jgi:hypothetical protein
MAHNRLAVRQVPVDQAEAAQSMRAIIAAYAKAAQRRVNVMKTLFESST